MSSAAGVVDADGVTKAIGGRTIVDDVSLTVAAGSIVGLIGPSGSGKTTTVRLLLGLLRPTGGRVRVFGHDPATFDARQRSRLGYMPQLSALYPTLSIAENLHFAAKVYGVPRRQSRQALRETLEFVELTEHRKTLLRDASGGMQRRVALAATLLHDPELLFLDEPTTGIDPVLRRKFWDRFASLRESGRTLFVTTQYVGEAEHCDSVALLVSGRLLALTTPEGLRRKAFGGDFLDVALAEADEQSLALLRSAPGVLDIEEFDVGDRVARLLVSDAEHASSAVQATMKGAGVDVRSVSRHLPSFDDAFVRIVSRQQPRRAGA